MTSTKQHQQQKHDRVMEIMMMDTHTRNRNSNDDEPSMSMSMMDNACNLLQVDEAANAPAKTNSTTSSSTGVNHHNHNHHPNNKDSLQEEFYSSSDSHSGSSTTGSDVEEEFEDDDEEDEENSTNSSHRSSPLLAHKETMLVNGSKMLVVVVVSLLAAVVGLGVFFYVRKQEETAYNTEYMTVVTEIISTCQQRTKTILDNLESLSMSLTAQATSNAGSMVWPFVIFPEFAVQGIMSNQVTGASSLSLHPIVSHANRAEWERFSVEYAKDWMTQAHVLYDNRDQDQDQDHTKDQQQPSLVVDQQNRFNSSSGDVLEEWDQAGITPFIWVYDDHMQREPTPDSDFYTPMWQRVPAEQYAPTMTNLNLAPEQHRVKRVVQAMIFHDRPVFTASSATGSVILPKLELELETMATSKTKDKTTAASTTTTTTTVMMDPEIGPPHTFLFQPIHDSLSPSNKNSSVVAFLSATLRWDTFLLGALPKTPQDDDEHAIHLVLEGTCEHQAMTFELVADQVNFLGAADLHDPIFENMMRTFQFDTLSASSMLSSSSSSPHHQQILPNASSYRLCQYSARIYPSREWADDYFTDMPMVYAVSVICCFLFTTILFAMYDFLVQLRQNKVMATAAKTSAIVSSLFPSNVRDRLLQELEGTDSNDKNKKNKSNPFNTNSQTSGWPKATSQHRPHGSALLSKITTPPSPRDRDMDASTGNLSIAGLSRHQRRRNSNGNLMPVETSEIIFGSKPIADLFPNTTIMFADMVGFTAWSSSREPTQVFTLLETVYHSFDQIAKRRRIFKVETVGDCYVAVAGLPVARKDHAVAMCRFASDCLVKMNELTGQLEKALGPDTSELALRVGLHSGPVTAGVLRGEKGRFQLFGDTMNTASRMESTGKANHVQISSETADLLIASGKQKWIVPRMEKIHAKGKGELQTYFLAIHGDISFSGNHASSSTLIDLEYSEEGTERGGMCDASTRFFVPEAFTREQRDALKTQRLVDYNVDILAKLLHQIVVRRAANPPKMVTRIQRKNFRVQEGLVLDEVKDIIALPQFDANTFKNHIDPNTLMLSPRIHTQLNSYVSKIAALYRDNPFHNFEHASHVTLSVTKLLSRIVNPNEVHNRTGPQQQIAEKFHDHTFGITSDPLTHFGCVLSALVHDCGHPGVTNAVLVTEKHPLARQYHGKSVAEQQSVDLSWNILMEPEFDDLRACIYGNEEEFLRFRQVIVNIVMATDIMDKELGAARKARWEKAFSKEVSSSLTSSTGDTALAHVNRKATIVLEHLIQASDVAHTMQHWHVYRKWNERLFHEMYRAYLNGRLDTDPSESWYQGEIGFFDYYIIPLAKKLETCGVFGVSSHEYLSYAEGNRREWVNKGQDIVKSYLESYSSAQQQTQQQQPKQEQQQQQHEP